MAGERSPMSYVTRVRDDGHELAIATGFVPR